jgi:hypothetical protein
MLQCCSVLLLLLAAQYAKEWLSVISRLMIDCSRAGVVVWWLVFRERLNVGQLSAVHGWAVDS